MDAIQIEVVERSGVESLNLSLIDPCRDVANAEVDAANLGQHPRFVCRVEPPVVVYDDIVGSEEIRVPYIDVVIGIESKDALQALSEIVFFQEAPGLVIAGDQQIDEFGVEVVPPRDDVVALPKLPGESLVIYRMQVDGARSGKLALRIQYLDA
jgi:hypothetical protein